VNFPKKRAVLIYGDSIFLTGISETLRVRGNWRVSNLAPQADFAMVLALHPDLILVDAQQFTLTQTEQFMATFPDGHSPPIFRLSLDAQRLTVLSSQQFPATSLDDLVQALETISKAT
jgi:hypothetical protein